MRVAEVLVKLALFVNTFLVYFGFDASKFTVTGLIDSLNDIKFAKVASF